MLSLWSHRLTPLIAFCMGAFVTIAVTSHAKAPRPKRALEVTPAAVIPAEKTDRRIAPSKKAAIQILARGDNAFLGILRMEANGKVPEHQDATEEYIYVLEGSGTVTIDGKASQVRPGTTIFMPAYAKVSFVGGATPLVAFQVFAGPSPANKYNTWKRMTPTKPDGTVVLP